MKALVFSVLTLALAVQAQATCSARAGGDLKTKPDYSRLLNEPAKASTPQVVQTARAQSADGKPRK